MLHKARAFPCAWKSGQEIMVIGPITLLISHKKTAPFPARMYREERPQGARSHAAGVFDWPLSRPVRGVGEPQQGVSGYQKDIPKHCLARVIGSFCFSRRLGAHFNQKFALIALKLLDRGKINCGYRDKPTGPKI